MNDHVKSLFEQARNLTSLEREDLAEMLLASLEVDPAIESAWMVESERRWREHELAPSTASDAFTAVDEARHRLKRRDAP